MTYLSEVEAQRFEVWRRDVAVAARQRGMSVKITDDHWDWFRVRFEEGHSVSGVLQLAQDANLT